MAITPGSKIEVRTASGTTVAMLAVSEPMQGQDFPVVWVCTPDEFERGESGGRRARLDPMASGRSDSMSGRHPTPEERDERAAIPVDPEEALRGLLAVKPEDDDEQDADDG